MKNKIKSEHFSLRKHTDSRGWLMENAKPEFLSEIRHFFICQSKPGQIRGNHYHHHKKEWFFILQGEARVYLYDLRTKKRKSFIVKQGSNKLIEMAPEVAHAIQNIGKEKLLMLAFVNEVFAPKNPDTYTHIILK